jgi:hypothetical protein
MAIGIGAPLAFRSLPVVKEKTDQDAAIAQADAELAEGQMLKARLEGDVRLLQHDAEYLSIFAYDLANPGYMAPGVTIFQLPPGQN